MAKKDDQKTTISGISHAFRQAADFAGRHLQTAALGASLLVGADLMSSWLFSTTSLVTPLIAGSAGAFAGLIGGIGALLLTSKMTVANALGLGSKMKLSAMAIGVAIGSLNTIPELFVSLGSVYRGAIELGLGNVIGSNIAHTLLILGTTAAVAGIARAKDLSWKFNSLMLAGTTALFGSQLAFGNLYPAAGLGMLAAGAYYLKRHLPRRESNPHNHTHEHGHEHRHEDDRHGHQEGEVGACLFHDHGESEDEKRARKRPRWLNAAIAGSGMAGLIAASSLVVDSGINLANSFNLASLGFNINFGFSQALVGSMFVAIGTSLPELFVNLEAIRRRNSDMAVGNILGCSIINTLVAGGALSLFAGGMPSLSGMFSGVAVPEAFSPQTTSGLFNLYAFAGSSGILAAILLSTKGAVSRLKGALALLAYTGYLAGSIAVNDGKAPHLHDHGQKQGAAPMMVAAATPLRTPPKPT